MEVYSDHNEIMEKMDEDVYSGEKMTDLELEVKLESPCEIENIKTEVFEEQNNFEPLQIIGEKRKNQETSTFDNKKIKEEFVIIEEVVYNQGPKEELQDIEEINLDDSNNQVI